MSNCINILTDIVIPIKHVNTINLFHDMEEINGLSNVGWGGPLKDFVIWWFLSEKNVKVEGDGLIISLGEHRSSHTERDFHQVGFVLAEYIVGLVDDEFIHCPVRLQNECDGFSTTYDDELILKAFSE